MKNLIFEMKKNAGLYEDEQILNEGLFGPSTDAKVANLVNLIKNTSLKTSDSIAVQEKNELLGQIKTYGSKVAELLKQDPKNKQAATWIDKAYSEADALHKGSFADSQKKEKLKLILSNLKGASTLFKTQEAPAATSQKQNNEVARRDQAVGLNQEALKKQQEEKMQAADQSQKQKDQEAYNQRRQQENVQYVRNLWAK